VLHYTTLGTDPTFLVAAVGKDSDTVGSADVPRDTVYLFIIVFNQIHVKS